MCVGWLPELARVLLDLGADPTYRDPVSPAHRGPRLLIAHSLWAQDLVRIS